MYKKIIRPLLFLFDPEKVHYHTLSLLKIALFIPGFKKMAGWWTKDDLRLERKVLGITFKNPVGLAAGFDKDAKWVNRLDKLGFGFIEIGTVTPRPQVGNAKPRLFRLPSDQSLINRMGFNNEGVDIAVKRLKTKNKGVVIGGNIGKNKTTPNENAVDDYIYCFEALFPYVDYFTVNISSPNTPNLRELQEKEPLRKLLSQIQELNFSKSNAKPILLKIAPDLTNTQLDDIIEIVIETKLAGVIATNTTVSRENLISDAVQLEKIGAGGLSGKALTQKSTEIIKYLKDKSEGKFVIIGAGGIMSAQDAVDKLNAGASLIQLYTGFIYEGPGLIAEINKKLVG